MISFNKNVKDRILITYLSAESEDKAKAFNTALKTKLREVFGSINSASGFNIADGSRIHVEPSNGKDKVILFSHSQLGMNFFGAYNYTSKEDEQGEQVNAIDYALQVAEEQGITCSCSVIPSKSSLTYDILCY